MQGRKGGREESKKRGGEKRGFGGDHKEVGPQQKWRSYCVTAQARSFRGMLSWNLMPHIIFFPTAKRQPFGNLSNPAFKSRH